MGWSSSFTGPGAVLEWGGSHTRTVCASPLPALCKSHWLGLHKRSARFCSHLLLIYSNALCKFLSAGGRLSSLRQESGPWRLVYLSPLLARENRPKAERGGTPHCHCTQATQTQLMPDVQTLTLWTWSLCHCTSDEQIPKDGHPLTPANKQTPVEKGAINKAVNQFQQNKTLKQTTLRGKPPECPPNPGHWAECKSPTRWKVETCVCIFEMASLILNCAA